MVGRKGVVVEDICDRKTGSGGWQDAQGSLGRHGGEWEAPGVTGTYRDLSAGLQVKHCESMDCPDLASRNLTTRRQPGVTCHRPELT